MRTLHALHSAENAKLAKSKTKCKHRLAPRLKAVVNVDLKTILDRLDELGITANRMTFNRYEKKYKLIPEAINRGSLGRGKGRFAEYPEDTVGEFVASWNLLNSPLCKNSKEATEIREKALAADAAEKQLMEQLADLKSEDEKATLFNKEWSKKNLVIWLSINQQDDHNHLAYKWLNDKYKILEGFSPKDDVSISYELKDGKAEVIVKLIPDWSDPALRELVNREREEQMKRQQEQMELPIPRKRQIEE